jgi:hypothetical protein
MRNHVRRSGEVETNLEQCPLCGSDLSRTKFREIQGKLRVDDQKKLAELAQTKLEVRQSLEQEFKKDFEQQKQAAEKKAKEEADQRVKKALAQSEEFAKKVRESEAREAGIRKQAQLEIERQKEVAEKKAKADAELQIKKANAERDQAAVKLKAAELREVESRKQAQEEAEKQRQKQLMEQRQALEKDKTLALLKMQAEHGRERDSLQKKLKMMEHQVQKKTPNELGDGAEIDLFEALRDRFQGDKIRRIPKGQAGADILHEILYKGESCGMIITDAKNRQGWQNAFVTKLRQDQVDAGAEHAILATAVFPTGKKELCIESGVIVVSPGRVVYITEILRQAMVAMHIKDLSLKERSNKMSQLYSLITSESHSKKFAEAERLAQDILDLDAQEVKDHGIVWRKRGTLATRVKNVLREVETDVAAVIEGGGEERQELTTIKVSRVAS